MLFTIEWLAGIFPDCQGLNQPKQYIDEVITDSRKQRKNTLFIPIVGERFDGHQFIEQAYQNGAAAVLWEKDKILPDSLPSDFPVFFVDDTTIALQQLAKAYRKQIKPTVIGITGSNGKTSTKDIVSAVLRSSYRTHATVGNLNNHIGMPLTILSMARDTEMLVLEMGMSNFGEIELLSRIAEPDYAIITNIGESHIEFLGSREGILQAKLEIRKGMNEEGILIFDGDEALLKEARAVGHTIAVGFSQSNDYMIQQTELTGNQTTFDLSNGHTYTIPLLGRHHAKNTSYAIALAEQLNIGQQAIKAALDNLQLTSMRFEISKAKNGATMINDAYNASPTSMKAAIDIVKQMAGYDKKVLVLGDIFELGTYSEVLHQRVAEVIEAPITAVYTYGQAAVAISKQAALEHPKLDIQHFTSKDALIQQLNDCAGADTLILFKASRGMAFETLVQAVQ
ncbi:UDP-N-acetylmuramoyl-tripeptide--D-alanyl-D-alanine ligase [Ornithinibacillus gellani]|uniref:UDP-N-acetylmuramoyl-tripeptide--D-alanyl-D- alanine ligase n=1 Tax=Ornithinibacillus gellani TaxID=2293253 RepID=UPI000F4A7FC4|nr:UDP-N-acetylmuramoyl-tripeptide--D-alanyl-D-alanine ligase [Ornithinibacillus gellani]TQS75653.1 UDP-N-acetylmuramoyl-tripeptide--D-alanyl-D-alanine ligase [Ornithinibacillus gellani]